MYALLLVIAGGGIGAGLRHGVNLGAARWLGMEFPWGTLTVNVVGSFLIGVLAAWFAFRGDSYATQSLRLFLTTGILGGFTTFSAFSLDAANMMERGQHALAAAYIGGSVALGLAGLFLGLWIARAMFSA